MMNNEIKEILDYIDDRIIPNEKWNKIKDYINNLQEENERLREVVENLTTMTVCGDRKQIKNTAQFKLEQCQSRIDKAIEYCNNIMFETKREEKIQDDLLDILQGEDE